MEDIYLGFSHLISFQQVFYYELFVCHFSSHFYLSVTTMDSKECSLTHSYFDLIDWFRVCQRGAFLLPALEAITHFFRSRASGLLEPGQWPQKHLPRRHLRALVAAAQSERRYLQVRRRHRHCRLLGDAGRRRRRSHRRGSAPKTPLRWPRIADWSAPCQWLSRGSCLLRSFCG